MNRPFFKELDELYKRILQRPIDPSGYRTYSNFLERGKKSIDDIAGILRSSDEYQRLINADKHSVVFDVPHRSPLAVADAIKDVIAGKLVCDIGCAEGDNLVSLGRHAGRAIGLECDPLRYQRAVKRGFEVTLGDYWQDPVPPADVYYFFLTDGSADNEFLISKLLDDESFQGVIIVAADSSITSEVMSIRRCARLGKLRAVPYDEGIGERQRGIFLLAVINAGEARVLRKNRRKEDRRVIVTLGIGRDMEELMKVTLPGMEVYADATGSDLCLISQPQIMASSIFYEVFQAARLFNYYDRVLYIDLDIIIREDAPDLFDLVPADHIGAFFESRMQSLEEVEFFNNPQSAVKGSEQTKDPGHTRPRLAPDAFNNGVTVMARQHRFVMGPLAEYPDDAVCTDQTVMNTRVINSGVPVYDITEAFNYLVCRLDKNDEGYRRGAWMIHYGGLPLPIKPKSASQDLFLWREGVAPPDANRTVNRIFRRLVPAVADTSMLDKLNPQEMLVIDLCDGIRKVFEIVEDYSRSAGCTYEEGEHEVVSILNALLDEKRLVAKNQYSHHYGRRLPVQ